MTLYNVDTNDLINSAKKLTEGLLDMNILRASGIKKLSAKTGFFQFSMNLKKASVKNGKVLTVDSDSLQLLIKKVNPSFSPTEILQVLNIIEEKLTTLGFLKKEIYTSIDETEGTSITIFEDISILKLKK